MKCLLSLLLLAGLVALINASCTAQVTSQARAGAWATSNGEGEVIDLIIKNTGTCTLTGPILINFNLPLGSSILSAWGLTAVTGGYSMTLYNPILPGQTVGGYQGSWGVVADLTVTTPLFSPAVLVFHADCLSCTVVPPPSTCQVTGYLSMRSGAGSSWTQNGVNAQIYDVILTDTGSATLTSVDVTIVPALGTAIDFADTWNLVYLGGNSFAVQTYGSLNQNNAQYNGAGLVILGTSAFEPTFHITNFAC